MTLGELQKLKENEIFAVMDRDGTIPSTGSEGQGLYFRDTRFLSLYELSIDGVPMQLMSADGELNFMSNLQLSNGPGLLADGTRLRGRTLSIRRNRFLDSGLHERIGIFNYNPFAVSLTVHLCLGSDFRDMFDIRNMAPPRPRGWIAEPEHHGPAIRLGYTGLDGAARTTRIDFDRPPDAVEVLHQGEASDEPPQEDSGELDPRAEDRRATPIVRTTFHAAIPARHAWSLTVHVVPTVGVAEAQSPHPALDESFTRILHTYEVWEETCTRISTDHELLNALIRQSLRDLRLTINDGDDGLLPMAGIPWFSVPFGRDSLITSLQTLCLNPEIAYGTLRFLARYQGHVVDPWRHEEPGKILHELRTGELAALREVPHTPYYASIDATPLFIYLLTQLVRWTGDWDLAAALRPNLERALNWMYQYGDLDGDGLLEYASKTPRGMRHQAWKDSFDGVQFADGRLAAVPIAPVEVQGYCYGAELGAAELYRHWGELDRAEELVRSARTRKRRFEQAFWMEAEGYYAQALDADKVQIPAVTSNPGHCLLMDLLDGPRGDAVARRLLQEDLLSGWGVRTLSEEYPSFNPMSYHNGSIWPHDNSLIVAGLHHRGYHETALRVTDEVLAAAFRLPQYRLPELYCGFSRDQRYHSSPATYPTACSPHSWAAASVFLILQHLIGLEPDLPHGSLRLRPRLLPWLNEVHFEDMRLGSRRVSVHVWREGADVRWEVTGAEGLQATAG